jgi:hypothetical protein
MLPRGDKNYISCQKDRSASTVSLCWLSDGTIIVKNPYFNIHGFHGEEVGPSPIAIEDNMFNGGKKDASYIANLLDAVTQ